MFRGWKWPKYSHISTFRQNSNNALFAQNTEKVPTFGLHIHVFMFSPIWSILGILDITCHGIDPFSALLTPFRCFREDPLTTSPFPCHVLSLFVSFLSLFWSVSNPDITLNTRNTRFFTELTFSILASFCPKTLHFPPLENTFSGKWRFMRFGVFDTFSQKPFQNQTETFQEMVCLFDTFGSILWHAISTFGISRSGFTPYRQIWGSKRTHI